MENFEISDNLVGITQIWEVFFLPIVSVAIVFLFIYFLMGKQRINHIYTKYKILKLDNKYYRQKHIKIKIEHSNGNKRERVILLPLSEMSEKMVISIQNPIVFIIIFLLSVYAIYKLINLFSLLYPIKYCFVGASMLLYSTPKEIVAEIWTYFPEYTLESLYQKISILGDESSYAKYVDYSAIHMFGNIFKFCSVLCILNFFINKPKIIIYLRTLFLFLVCFFGVVLSFYFQFQKDAKVLEQKAYYTEKQLVLDDPLVPTDFEVYQLAIEKVENELRYVDNQVFYGSFGLDFVFLKLGSD